MRGFKQFILNESAVVYDIAALCTGILNDPSVADVNWDIIIEIMETVNPPKADYLRKAVERGAKDTLQRLLRSGQDGFITLSGGIRYLNYLEGFSHPSLEVQVLPENPNSVRLYTNDFESERRYGIFAEIQFKKSVCGAAANKQMGLAQYIGKNLNNDQLDLSKVSIPRSHIGAGEWIIDKEDQNLIAKVKELVSKNGAKTYAIADQSDTYVVSHDFEGPDAFRLYSQAQG